MPFTNESGSTGIKQPRRSHIEAKAAQEAAYERNRAGYDRQQAANKARLVSEGQRAARIGTRGEIRD